MPVYTLPARKLSTREEQALLAMVQAAPAPSAADDRRAAAGSRTATERRANQARRILVSFHTTPLLRAASALARRTQGLVSAAELVDSGLKGLNRAIDRFDASSYSPSGLRKYAAVWMRGEMRSCIRDKAAAMGTPRAVQAMRARVRAAALQLRDARGGVDALNTQEEVVRLAGSWTCSDVAMLGVFINCVCNQAQILRHASNECGDLQDAIASELQLPRAAVQAALSPMGTSLRWQPDSGAQPLAAPPLAPGEHPPGGMNRRGAMQAAIDGVLDTLSERERTILRLRWAFCTCAGSYGGFLARVAVAFTRRIRSRYLSQVCIALVCFRDTLADMQQLAGTA